MFAKAEHKNTAQNLGIHSPPQPSLPPPPPALATHWCHQEPAGHSAAGEPEGLKLSPKTPLIPKPPPQPIKLPMGLRAGTASQDSQSDGRYGLYAPGPTHGDGDTAATASDPSAPSRAAGGRPAALQPNGHGAGRNSAKPRLTQQLSNEPRSITPALGPTLQVARWGFGSTKCLRWRCWCRDRHCCWSRCYQRQCSKHPRL